MEIMTDIFGEVSYEASDIIYFQEGLYGFDEAKRFLLLEILDTPYRSLQSLDVDGLAFTVTTPFAFYGEYEFEISDRVVQQIEIESLDDLDIYTTIVLHDPLTESTLNLKAPILVNTKKNLGKQVILNEDYPLKYKFLTAVEE